MAKNFKLQIKNSQLAEAINLRGLKAKLSKKKPGEEDSEDAVLETEHQEAEKSSHAKANKSASKSAPSKKKQADTEQVEEKKKGRSQDHASDTSSAIESTSNESREAVIEPVFSTLLESQHEMKEKAPTFSTLHHEATDKEERDLSAHRQMEVEKEDKQEIIVPTREPAKEIKTSAQEQSFAESEKSMNNRTDFETVKSREIPQQSGASERPAFEAHKKPMNHDESSLSTKAASQPKASTPPVFLSASRNNPDKLGPVLDKKLAAPSKPQQPPRPEREPRSGGQGTSQPFNRDRSPHQGGDYQRDRAPHQGGDYQRDRAPHQGRDFQRDRAPHQGRDFQRDRAPHQGGDFQRDRTGASSGDMSSPQQPQRRPLPPRDGQDGQRRQFERRPEGGRSQDDSSYQPRREGFQQREGYPQRQFSGGSGSGFNRGPSSRPAGGGAAGYSQAPRRSEGGFKPQPFVSRQAPAGADTKQPGWDRAVPQKEGAEERAQNRRLSLEGPDEKKVKVREVKEGKTAFKKTDDRGFDSRLRHGLQSVEDDDQVWRKRRPKSHKGQADSQESTRPTKIKVRLPVSVKDLAQEMKLKAAQLIAKLFLQGIVVTLNDMLDDETMVQLLGHEFGCEVTIDTSEQERLKLSEGSIRDEISKEDPENVISRPPVVAFMGHVDHGKTSLIDAIRKTNRAQSEVGAITQHVGAFSCKTSHGPVTILDTPGHEAFSAMRERGAEVTDIIVLVVAGDEGMKEQTVEALKQAKAAQATIIVAINKCDKPAFDQERVYRQLADQELLPESWGGQTITVNCSAVTGKGIDDLLEMIGLQSEVLELKANPNRRARGTVIESEMHKGLGPVATVLVQNGTLKSGDCLVFDFNWAKVKSMRDDMGREIALAPPSTPVRINGLSGFPEAGEEFVVVANEKEAREVSEARQEGRRQLAFQVKKKFSLENMAEKAGTQKKTLNLILRADVQGSLEALKTALLKIESKKVEINVVSMGVGEISESDVQLASASKSIIIGFHTQVESHAEPMMKEMGVEFRLHNIIYHAQDDVRELMKGLLDKIAQETDKGKAEVKATFKSSQLGIIAGCQVADGSITRNCNVRVVRGGNVIWKGSISSLKRFKDDVREVTKGTECGIVLQGFSDFNVGDMLEAYEITYLEQEL